MDMWNWLIDSYNEKTLSLEDLNNALQNDDYAADLWRDFSSDNYDFVDYVRDEIKPLIKYLESQLEKNKIKCELNNAQTTRKIPLG